MIYSCIHKWLKERSHFWRSFRRRELKVKQLPKGRNWKGPGVAWPRFEPVTSRLRVKRSNHYSSELLRYTRLTFDQFTLSMIIPRGHTRWMDREKGFNAVQRLYSERSSEISPNHLHNQSSKSINQWIDHSINLVCNINYLVFCHIASHNKIGLRFGLGFRILRLTLTLLTNSNVTLI